MFLCSCASVTTYQRVRRFLTMCGLLFDKHLSVVRAALSRNERQNSAFCPTPRFAVINFRVFGSVFHGVCRAPVAVMGTLVARWRRLVVHQSFVKQYDGNKQLE